MIDITDRNFETELINASMRQPVLLDIWAEWCGPCKALGPVLERLETAYEGRFTLAKLDADAQPEIASQLSQMFGVRSIPFCVLFKGGQPVDGFVGALPEAQVRQFLDRHVPSPEEVAADEDLDEAHELLAEGDTDSALAKLKAALAANPSNDAARADYLLALLDAGQVDEARRVHGEVASNVLLNPRVAAFGHWIAAIDASKEAPPVDTLQAAIGANKRDFDARFALAQHHFARRDFTAAMDELLEILMRDKGWRDELARKTYVAILEVMTKPPVAPKPEAAPKGTLEVAGKVAQTPSDPVVDAYRRKLSMALF
ncbi:tetratricopeptide repeat protein [Piscinibacter koreensis]|uniref:Tetratricopeptide repeat protein n=1 Tax=Piscinibacter koreensis TaxID=2742824 RepID=A0A7Y6NNT9_9BURK|nr:tetratricopeptide repeat protein [Schlegelella koreensis]NUZ06449.1 tetratricopeptide repeat protein [Schlegelella koreensis]